MNKTSLLPWSQLMAFGLGKLKLSSISFWSMSLREMDAAIEGYFGKPTNVSAPSRKSMMHLIAEYPDEKME